MSSGLSLLIACCCLKVAGAGFFSSPGFFLSHPLATSSRQLAFPLYFRPSTEPPPTTLADKRKPPPPPPAPRDHDHTHHHDHPPPRPRPSKKSKAAASDQQRGMGTGTATLNFEPSSPSLYVSGRHPGIITAKSAAAVPAPVVVRSRSYSFAPPEGLGGSSAPRRSSQRVPGSRSVTGSNYIQT